MRRLFVFVILVLQPFFGIYSQGILKELKAIDANPNDSSALASLEALVQKTKPTGKELLEINRRMVVRANNTQKFEKALELSNQSIPLAKKNGFDSLEAVFTKYIGMTYYYMDRRKASVPWFEKALVIAHANNFWELEASCNNNIGGALADIQQYEKAEPYLLKCINLLETNGKENLALRSYRVLARLYSESGKKEKAESIYLTLIEKAKKNKDTAFLCDNLIFYSTILSSRGDADKAVSMSEEALNYRRKQKNIQDLWMTMSFHASNLSAAGRYKEAYHLVDTCTYLMREVFASNLEKGISEVEVKYKTEQLRQEKALAELKTKEQRQIYIFSSIGVLTLMISAIFIRNQRQKAKHLAELAEGDKLRFKEVIDAEEKERSRIAQELHDGLGQLLSTARLNVAGLEDSVTKEDKPDLDRSLKIIDEACTEVRNISHNMMPGALIRLGLVPAITELVHNVNAAKAIKIDFNTNVESSLGKSLDITIYRVVQEVLNNMIRHAKASLISMNIEKKSDILEILIRDNGTGFDPEELKKSKGMGWKNIFSRVSMLDGSIKLESELQKGTMVFIHLKLKNEPRA